MKKVSGGLPGSSSTVSAATPKSAATEQAHLPSVEAITKHLFDMQQCEVERDTGIGLRTARQLAERFRVPTNEMRLFLRDLAAKRIIRGVEALKGLYWRSTNPLPWEPGGKWPGQDARELAALREQLQAATGEVDRLQAAIAAATKAQTASDGAGNGTASATDGSLQAREASQ